MLCQAAVTGCQLLNPQVRIELLDCERCRITGNNVIDQRPTPTMREAIRIRGKIRHNLVAGNIVGTLHGKREKPAGSRPARRS